MAVWIALAVLLVAVLGGIAYAAVRGFQLYRTAKRSGAVFTSEMDRISRVSEQIEHHAAAAEAAAGRLKDASGRLATSRARLDLQIAAVREARAQVRRVFWFVPGV